MINEIQAAIEQAKLDLQAINSLDSLELFRLKYLVKKGVVQGFIDRLREVPKEDKPVVGKTVNELRSFVESSFNAIKEDLESKAAETPQIDVTLPGRNPAIGTVHPVYQTMDEMTAIFEAMGFNVVEGPDIENDEYNFDSLNFAPDHPARDMQDTFFIEGSDMPLLRTHTSPVQVRVMRSQKPPIRAIMPGRVYRNEAISARALAEFHQIEGLYIDKNVSFAELKATLMVFAKKMYGENSAFRFRPSYFPFTEPSAELDITCYLCKGSGCRICKGSGWLEIAGCGMVHPNVLKAGGIDPEIYTGYAFGFGIERVTLLRAGITDIRALYENDDRTLKQF